MRPVVDAVVLAGGGGRRLGGVSKGEVELAGQRLVDHVLGALQGARQVVVVGELPVPEGVLLTREDPPGGGPAAGVVAGLERLGAESSAADWVLVLACDLPGAGEVVPELLAAVEGVGRAVDSVLAVDAAGRPQWLLGVHRWSALARAAAPLGPARDLPLRALLGDLHRHEVRPAPVAVEDVDTWADHSRWADRLTREEHTA
ncbi:molybdenum cofactor guanylyltransferase [Kytococcus sedentarius]|uniref:molybdenum cofactor guanylyltransferase n=1 Tax=Kytococcus sedentarius TaxID=1276 RepID=UPI0035BBB571